MPEKRIEEEVIYGDTSTPFMGMPSTSLTWPALPPSAVVIAAAISNAPPHFRGPVQSGLILWDRKMSPGGPASEFPFPTNEAQLHSPESLSEDLLAIPNASDLRLAISAGLPPGDSPAILLGFRRRLS